MLTIDAKPRRTLKGKVEPGLAPPVPARTLVKDFMATADKAGIALLPWQKLAARYLTALGAKGWLYREVAVIVARRNGKTELLVPRILMDLRAGRKVIHTAQNRTLPREVFMRIVELLEPGELKRKPREANGQEHVEMRNGGSYRIVAPQRGARGLGADTLIFDELREFEDYDVIAAARPTLASSKNPQTLYLSNAGSDASVVLNDLRQRALSGSTTLAYLEWSALPERKPDDRAGWAEANPGLGTIILEDTLEEAHDSLPLAKFRMEHLCQWPHSEGDQIVANDAWLRCRSEVGKPEKPAMAVNVAGEERASGVLAWRRADGRIAVRLLVDARPAEDTDALQDHLRKLALEHRARKVGFAAWTDAALMRGWQRAKAIDNKEFAAACGLFTELVNSGRLAWDGDDLIGDDLAFATRKPHESGAWVAVPANTDRPITAALAAIRAVYLASERHQLPRIG